MKTTDWVEILETIMLDIYRYIDTDSSEGQDILNMFFIAFLINTQEKQIRIRHLHLIILQSLCVALRA